MGPVEIMEVLEAREQRALRQKRLLEEYGKPLICFTMNIAGPVKNSEEIAWAFQYGTRLLLRQLDRVKATLTYKELLHAPTGNEGYFVVDAEPLLIKQLMVELEDHLEIGRLFDLDVLASDGKKLEREHERGCLICGAPGKSCARSRKHAVEELQKKTTEIIGYTKHKWMEETIAELACRALLFEACTTPKPGLVDCRNSGSHQDMNLFTFLSSASSLHNYFSDCVRIGHETSASLPYVTFSSLRWPGKLAELRMLDVTNGINTHKGAIFTLGVLCGALGRLGLSSWDKYEAILHECAAMTEGVSESELSDNLTPKTAGECLYRSMGLLGIRGQIETGLPVVGMIGLPALNEAAETGKTIEEAGIRALLSMMSHMEDTNIYKRGGVEGHQWVLDQTTSFLKKNNFSREALEELDDMFIDRNLSSGGAADLLSVCYFLYFLKQEVHMLNS